MTSKPSREVREGRKEFFDTAPYPALWAGIMATRLIGAMPEVLSDFGFFAVVIAYRRLKNLWRLAKRTS